MLEHSLIADLRKTTEFDAKTAFDYWLTLAKNSEMTVLAISDSKLLSSGYNSDMLASSNEDTRLACTHKDCTEFALIDIDTG